MEKIILFDLEQTLISDWFEDRETLLPLKFPELKEWIINQMPFKAGVLSFAIADDKDLDKFDGLIRPNIENNLLFNFDDNLIFTVDSINSMINEWNKTPFERDNMGIFKKEGVMRLLWKNLFTEPNTHVILVDDTVDDSVTHRSTILKQSNGNFTSSVPIKNSILEFVNPWTIIRDIK